MTLSMSLDKNYYRQPTHVFNLPAGWTCPWALNCLTKADRDTGKLTTRPDKDNLGNHVPTIGGHETYVCYAARAERFPGVRESRWSNFDEVKRMVWNGDYVELPRNATHVRIHGSGDFYSQDYFDWWVEQSRANPGVTFWAFTKSVNYWVTRLGEIPDNMHLTASVGGKRDDLIAEHNLKTATVFHNIEDVPASMMIDLDDWEAQDSSRPSFALLENMSNKNQGEDLRIASHNERAELILMGG